MIYLEENPDINIVNRCNYYAAFYEKDEDKIFFTCGKTEDMKILCRVISHEFLHKILYNYISEEACDDVDNEFMTKILEGYHGDNGFKLPLKLINGIIQNQKWVTEYES